MVFHAALSAYKTYEPYSEQATDALLNVEGLWGAHLRRENVWANLAIAAQKEGFQPNPNFDLGQAIVQDPLASQFMGTFLGVNSEEEFEFTKLTLQKELADLRKIDRADGLTNFFMSAGATLLDPTILIGGSAVGASIALRTGAQALRSAGRGALFGGSTVAAQEGILQANQELRSWIESGANVTSSMVFGGLLAGGVGAYASRRVTRQLKKQGATDEMLKDKAVIQDGREYQLVSEETVKALAFTAPNVRTLTSNFKQAAGIMAKLDNAGLAAQRGDDPVALSPGGDVQSLVGQYVGKIHHGIKPELGRLARQFRERQVEGKVRPPWTVAKKTYWREVGKALETPSQWDEVNQGADLVKREFLLPMYERARKAEEETGEIFSMLEGIDEDNFVAGFTRFVDQGAVSQNQARFRRMLSEHFTEMETEKWLERQRRVRETTEQLEQDAADLLLDETSVVRLTSQLNDELEGLPGQHNVEALVGPLRQLEEVARHADNKTRGKAYTALKEFKEKYEERLEPFFADESRLNTRKELLENTASGLERRQLEAQAEADRLYTQQLRSIVRLEKDAQKLLNRIDKHGAKQLEGRLGALQASFDRLVGLRKKDPESRWDASRYDKIQNILEVMDEEPGNYQVMRENALLLLTEARATMKKVTQQRSVKIAEQERQIQQLDPGRAAELAKGLHGEAAGLQKRFEERFEEAGGQVDIFDNSLDVSGIVKELSWDSFKNIVGLGRSLGEAGFKGASRKTLPDLVRLNPDRVWSDGQTSLREFIQSDINVVMLRMARGLGPDVEMFKQFGTVDPLGRGSKWGEQLEQEFQDKLERVVRAEAGEPSLKALMPKTKVVDAARNPKRVFHGTSKAFEDFEGAPAYFMTDSPEVAGIYAETRVKFPPTNYGAGREPDDAANIRPVFVNMERPLTIDMRGRKFNEEIPEDQLPAGLELEDGATPLSVRLALVGKEDYDGIILNNVDDSGIHGKLSTTYSVSDPKQIISQFAKPARGTPQNASKAEAKLRKEYNERREDIRTTVQRLRNVRGLPDDPDSKLWQAGRFVQDFNSTLLSGKIALSSIPDTVRPIMTYGMLNTFGKSFRPLIGDMQQIKLSLKEAQLAGAATELTFSSRYHEIFDVLEDYSISNVAYKGMHYAAAKAGRVALFDYWTNAMKSWSASIAVPMLSQSIETLVGAGGKVTAKELKEATFRLAKVGIDMDLAKRIWAQMQLPDGAYRSQYKISIPNTANWTRDTDAADAFRAAVLRSVDNTIVTPGAGDIPRIVDYNILSRLWGQYRRFAFSSAVKVQSTAVQDATQFPLDVVLGAVMKLGLGAVAYAAKSIMAGGAREEQMRNADERLWVSEAISNSGLLGFWPYEASVFLERTVPDVLGAKTQRATFQRPLEQFMGPSEGLLWNAQNLIVGIDEPDARTVRAARRLTPYNGQFLFHRGFNMIEEAGKKKLGSGASGGFGR